MENFRHPYFATTVTDFRHRWHISLSTWFKDYIYVPLGGNRVSTPRCHLNIMTTFIISGMWHGANWTFIVWGTIHGALTFCIVCLAWILFRANTITDAFQIIKGISTNFGVPYMRVADFLAIALALSIMFVISTKRTKLIFASFLQMLYKNNPKHVLVLNNWSTTIGQLKYYNQLKDVVEPDNSSTSLLAYNL